MTTIATLMQPGVLIIDDEKKICSLLARIIALEGFTVLQAATGKEGLNLLTNHEVHVVVSDVKLPDVNGVELVAQIKQRKPYVEVINLTAFGTIQDGVKAMKNGAFDYITKGDDNEKIIPLVHKASEKALLQEKLFNIERSIISRHSFDTILGQSGPIKEAVALARKVAATDTTVLLLGETGTGKEVFAQAIHYEGNRRSYPFVAVNCSGFNPDLLESELFGYKAGAFTGALKDKKGLLEAANGGTIFLDEIGEMNLDLQAKLLRVLETQSFIKIGDVHNSKVNVRILAATNRNLKLETDAGKFRLDLYYRLSVFTIHLPSLNQRVGDIPVLAAHYLEKFASKVNKHHFDVDEGFIAKLQRHSWKGNIRELKNVIERVVILADDNLIDERLLPYEFHHDVADDGPGNSSMKLQAMEKTHILKVLNYTRGNKTEASRLLGIGLTTLYRKLDEYAIS